MCVYLWEPRQKITKTWSTDQEMSKKRKSVKKGKGNRCCVGKWKNNFKNVDKQF